MRKILLRALIVLGVFLLFLLIMKEAADASYFSSYDASLPFRAEVQSVQQRDDYERVRFHFDGEPGERVPTLLTFPKEMKGKVPCIVLLHGIGQKKEFLDEVCAPFAKSGFAMACFDQHMRGERRIKGGLLAEAVAFRKRPYKTINDARRLLDYLSTHPRIDQNRLYLVGASYGAIMGSTVVSFDKRIKAAVMIYGGAHLRTLLSAPLMEQEVGAVTLTLLRPLACYLLQPADPIHYVHGISPTPILFQNGSNDTLVSPAAAKKFQEAAGEPKRVTWYNSDHLGMLEEERYVIQQVLEEALQFLLEHDKPHRAEAPEKQEAA